jgi:Golgi phosphoprotein 3
MLTFAEEFLLLAHDEKSGDFVSLTYSVTSVALAGAVLMDLALMNRIDNDLDKLFLTDRTPTGEPILDFCLVKISALKEPVTTKGWVETLSEDGNTLREMALDRLVERGILRRENRRFLWVFHNRVYPMIDDREIIEVKKRIADIVFSDEIPNPRDIVLIALANASGLLELVFTRAEVERRRTRIEQIAKMDLIGQAVFKIIADIQAAVMMAAHPVF